MSATGYMAEKTGRHMSHKDAVRGVSGNNVESDESW